MTKPHLLIAALIGLAALAGCGDKKPAAQAQAGGEILPGSVSDAMLPLDTATSQPPLAPKVEKSAAKPGDEPAEEGAAAEAPAEPPAAPDAAPAGE